MINKCKDNGHHSNKQNAGGLIYAYRCLICSSVCSLVMTKRTLFSSSFLKMFFGHANTQAFNFKSSTRGKEERWKAKTSLVLIRYLNVCSWMYSKMLDIQDRVAQSIKKQSRDIAILISSVNLKIVSSVVLTMNWSSVTSCFVFAGMLLMVSAISSYF